MLMKRYSKLPRILELEPHHYMNTKDISFWKDLTLKLGIVYSKPHWLENKTEVVMSLTTLDDITLHLIETLISIKKW